MQTHLLAPIVIFCYNRPDHLKRTIEALTLNAEAKESDLIVFSDGPKNATDQPKVQEIRDYINTLSGFKSISLESAEKNKGLAKSIIDGATLVINKYGKIIVMEDDLICTKDFLYFINDALNFYEKTPNIFSVSGYNFQINSPINYNSEIAMIYRASSLGWATWKDQWQKVDWDVTDFKDFLKDKNRQDQLKNAGEDILPMIAKQQMGVINSWAVRWTYHHVKHNGYCLVPMKSKIKTIGNDGSGSNPVATTLRTEEPIFEGKVNLDASVTPNTEIIEALRKRNSPSLIRRIINLLKYKVW